MSKIAMISQPMNGLTDDVIAEERSRATKILNDMGYEVIDSYFKEEFKQSKEEYHDEVKNIAVNFLSRAIERMSMCDAVYFVRGWENARGCKIERSIAEAYGFDILDEEINTDDDEKRKVIPGQYYLHFKGGHYKVLCIAKHSETQEDFVVYQNTVYPDKICARPYDMFISKVDKVKYPDVQQEYRFELMKKLERK